MFASKHPLCMHSKRLFSGWFVCIYIYMLGWKGKKKKRNPRAFLLPNQKKRHVKFKMAACGKRINCRFFSKPPPLQSIEHLHSTHLYSFFGLWLLWSKITQNFLTRCNSQSGFLKRPPLPYFFKKGESDMSHSFCVSSSSHKKRRARVQKHMGNFTFSFFLKRGGIYRRFIKLGINYEFITFVLFFLFSFTSVSNRERSKWDAREKI